MITAASLKSFTSKDLAQMAKERGVPGWHSMRKEELVRALLRRRSARPQARNGRTKSLRTVAGVNGSSHGRRPAAPTPPRRPAETAATRTREKAPPSPRREKPRSPSSVRKIQEAHAVRAQQKNLAGDRPSIADGAGLVRDRCVLMVRDPYWLHAYWEISRPSVERAKAALAEQWHAARPVLRLLEVGEGATTSASERIVRDIEIHGGVRNWYIDVQDPPRGFRVAIGYLSASGRFFSLVRSNSVTTPTPGGGDAVDENWTDVAANCERIFALSGGYSEEGSSGDLQELFEERLRRPMGSPAAQRYGVGAEGMVPRLREFQFELEAEMVVFGNTEPNSYVTLSGEPVKVREDGSFAVRLALPDRRQVLPIVASSSDGVEQRTIVLAVERNTKVMEPRLRDAAD